RASSWIGVPPPGTRTLGQAAMGQRKLILSREREVVVNRRDSRRPSQRLADRFGQCGGDLELAHEPNLGLGGMDVGIELAGRHLDRDHRDWMAPAREEGTVGRLE